MIKIKFCTRCELEQPIEDFIKDGKEFKTCIKCRNIGKIVSINHRLNIRKKGFYRFYAVLCVCEFLCCNLSR